MKWNVMYVWCFLHVEFLVSNWFCPHVLETQRKNEILCRKIYLIIIISAVIGTFIFCLSIIIIITIIGLII